MAEGETPNLTDVCKDFVRAMNRAEQAVGTVGQQLPKADRKAQMEEFFKWIETTPELPPNGLTRDVAREIVAQLSAFLMYDDYQGSANPYIA